MDLKKVLYLDGWSAILHKQKDDDKEKVDVSQEAGELQIGKLPFKTKDLGDILSKKTLDAHMQIHKKYVDRTRELVHGTEMAEMELDDVVKLAKKEPTTPLFRNASQAWNHGFYWMSISPPGQNTSPQGDLGNVVNRVYGSIDACREKMIDAASHVFGSGWVWLVKKNDTLTIMTTRNAGSPLEDDDATPLLCLDLWEHAYFLDYEGDRKSYIDSAVKQLLNWGFADKNWLAKEKW